MAITLEQAQRALADVLDPESGEPVGKTGALQELAVDERGRVAVRVALASNLASERERIGVELRGALAKAGASDDELDVTVEARAPWREVQADDPVPDAKHVILVMSGKGGVGKSTVAANLTMALSRAGHRVGLLDADIYGPSVPTMFGVMGRPTSADGKRIEPLERFGVKLMSIGFLLESPTAAVVWRGPMLQGALLQFLKDVHWGKLDYLVLDLPPGTGDIALTLSQRIRSTGAVVVTTPQEVALQDVYKSVSMCHKVGIPILGVVENESYFVCDGCSKKHFLFGSGGGAKVAEFAKAPLLAQIPIDPSVREWGDAGTPVVQAHPGSSVAGAFAALAERLVGRLDTGPRGPGLVIDRSGGSGPLHLRVAR